MKEKTLCVSAIKEGTVIDHITAGKGLKIIRLLQLMEKEKKITIGLNLKSSSMGMKDLIKIENTFLTPSDTDHIAIFSPLATVNVIKNYTIANKFSVNMPKKIEKVLLCPNSQCITHAEHTSTLFFIEENNDMIFLSCHFCEKLFSQEEITEV